MARTPKVGILIGNPRPFSRTTQVATGIGHQVAQAVGGAVGQLVELGSHGSDVLDPDADAVRRDVEAWRCHDLVVVASPTYKGTYTGMLKAFLDRLPSRGLAGVVAVPVMVGGAPHHSLAVDVHLRPLLVELGAVLPTPGLFVIDTQLDQLSGTVKEWLDDAAEPLRATTNAVRRADRESAPTTTEELTR